MASCLWLDYVHAFDGGITGSAKSCLDQAAVDDEAKRSLEGKEPIKIELNPTYQRLKKPVERDLQLSYQQVEWCDFEAFELENHLVIKKIEKGEQKYLGRQPTIKL
jgi:hypothetical protein